MSGEYKVTHCVKTIDFIGDLLGVARFTGDIVYIDKSM